MSKPDEIKAIEKPASEIQWAGRTRARDFFEPVGSIDLSRLRITDVGVYSVTPWREANEISRWIVDHFDRRIRASDLTITDGTANVGGNAINFCLNGFKAVTAIEYDDLTAQILKHNFSVYKLKTENVHHGDYLDFYKKIKQDIVFLDAPWGGPDYKTKKTLSLFLGQTNVSDICADLMSNKRASLVVLKVPFNFDSDELKSKVTNCKFTVKKIYRGQRHSYSLISCMAT
jgi:16S rRNA G966 N2-methylase RsmD